MFIPPWTIKELVWTSFVMLVALGEERGRRRRREVYLGRFWESWVRVRRGVGEERRRRIDCGPSSRHRVSD
jgi:hypothetical protein